MNIATRFIVTMFKFNIDDKASHFVTQIAIYLCKYTKHLTENNPLYRALAHTDINFA